MDERPATYDDATRLDPAAPDPATGGGWTPSPPPPVRRDAIGGDRAPLVGGVILIGVGLAFLLGRLVTFELGVPTWPLWIIVPGIAMLIGSGRGVAARTRRPRSGSDPPAAGADRADGYSIARIV